MKRTQIYLTEDEAEQVARMAAAERTTSSDVIRRAIDEYLARNCVQQDPWEGFRSAFGMWADMTDEEAARLLDRSGWERRFDD